MITAMTWIELTASAAGLLGTALLAIKSRYSGWGFVAYLASNAGWLWFAGSHGHWPLFWQYVGFTLFSIIGVWEWLVVPEGPSIWEKLAKKTIAQTDAMADAKAKESFQDWAVRVGARPHYKTDPPKYFSGGFVDDHAFKIHTDAKPAKFAFVSGMASAVKADVLDRRFGIVPGKPFPDIVKLLRGERFEIREGADWITGTPVGNGRFAATPTKPLDTGTAKPEPVLQRGQALVLAGPQGSGKSLLARKLAAQCGTFTEMDAREFEDTNACNSMLAKTPAAVIVDGLPQGWAMQRIKSMLISDEVLCFGKEGSARSARPPNFIFCTSEHGAAAIPKDSRRFRVVHLGAA